MACPACDIASAGYVRQLCRDCSEASAQRHRANVFADNSLSVLEQILEKLSSIENLLRNKDNEEE